MNLKLPLGYQDFASLRRDGCVYVDKTASIAAFLQQGKYFFLSRPRRFGKSLLCSTLQHLFEGDRGLFEGLWIEDRWDWSRKHPVIHVDLSLQDARTSESLEESLLSTLHHSAEILGISGVSGSAPKALESLLRGAAGRWGMPAVVILDEYDKPILDHITSTKTADSMRELLRSFYGVLKGCDPWLRLVFFTGVSKFAKVSVFSGLNQLVDLTLAPECTQICGYTLAEVRKYFASGVEALGEKLGLGTTRVWERLEEMYDGYWWGEGDRLCNPWSVMSCLRDRALRSYWFASGTPTMLLDMIRDRFEPPEELEGKVVTPLALEAFDVERLDLVALLWQAGYLTIRDVRKIEDRETYVLGYPNTEVREAWYEEVLGLFLNRRAGEMRPAADALKAALVAGDRQGFERELKALFAKVPYDLHIPREAYYHSLFIIVLSLMGVDVQAEKHTDKGRADAVLELEERVYVLEFKLGSAKDALAQIEARGYAESYRTRGRAVTLVGVGGFAEHRIEVLWK